MSRDYPTIAEENFLNPERPPRDVYASWAEKILDVIFKYQLPYGMRQTSFPLDPQIYLQIENAKAFWLDHCLENPKQKTALTSQISTAPTADQKAGS